MGKIECRRCGAANSRPMPGSTKNCWDCRAIIKTAIDKDNGRWEGHPKESKPFSGAGVLHTKD